MSWCGDLQESLLAVRVLSSAYDFQPVFPVAQAELPALSNVIHRLGYPVRNEDFPHDTALVRASDTRGPLLIGPTTSSYASVSNSVSWVQRPTTMPTDANNVRSANRAVNSQRYGCSGNWLSLRLQPITVGTALSLDQPVIGKTPIGTARRPPAPDATPDTMLLVRPSA